MYNDIEWGNRRTTNVYVWLRQRIVGTYARRIRCWDIGHSSDPVQNGMQQTFLRLEENGIALRNSWWKISVCELIPYYELLVPWTEDSCKVKEVEDCLFICDYYFCQSAQYLRSSRRVMWRIWSHTDWFRGSTRCYGLISVHCSTHWFVGFPKTVFD